MRVFDYTKLLKLDLTADIHKLIAGIYEYKGKQELYVANKADVLEKMLEVAKIQSTKSSNAIEGIITTDSRLNELMNKKAEPKNRDEEEIYAYRAVLDIIHESYDYIEFNKNNILTLHNRLYSFSNVSYRGKFKQTDNRILEIDADGEKKVRFQPVSSFETERYIEALIKAYKESLMAQVPPLLLIPVVILDFLCVHPFADGNGRMSRLLTLLLLYKFDFLIGRYISLEMLIEESKDAYYTALFASSANWHNGTNDELPFIKYMLSVVFKAYRDCDERFLLITERNLSSAEKVMEVFKNTLEPLSKADLLKLCPNISQRTVERALKELQEKGLIQLIGKGRASRYIKAPRH